MKASQQWQVVDLACQAYGLVGVSLYETLGPNTTEFITNHCPVPIIFASSNHLVDILKIAPRCPSLRAVVSMDRLSSGERDVLSQWSTSLGILLLDMADLEEWGLEPGNYVAPGPLEGERELDCNRIATISYTSGTTGNPKGVILTNWNMTSATLSQSLGGVEFFTKPGWRFMSYLPLSHIYERFLQILVIAGAGTICFSCGDTTKLLEDAQVFKPHFFPGVPRVWNRVHAAIQTQMDTPGLKGALLRQAVAAKRANWREHGQVTHRVYDALVFSKVRALLGGQVRYMSSGSAPLSGAVHELLKLCFSCDVVQGYGLTETVGTCSKGIAWDVGATGTCGHLTNCNEVMLADVAEMGYTHKDSPNPRGEVCIRGDNIFIGYLHDPENTSKALDKDGWFHTGDIGEFDSAGRLKIIDRVKNVVKLSQGEYVALEKLEGIYALNPLFAALIVHADSLRSSLVAIAVLDPALASKLVFDVLGEKIAPEDTEALDKAVQNEKIRDKIVAGFAQVAKKNKLNGFEHIRGVFPTVLPFADDLMTPTQKVKRNVAAKFFEKEIEEIYNKTEGKISKL
ncbi:Long chain acyl-CoA synthetase 7, peroxisomal [Vanrija pseudolonga]|uniref:Long chain acyl-CoA synthetase 7, peroxisomal n=1 Tax=Vanrija pseudolonga TaxID=143232 RepID=A0AAF0YFE1_9TREE|nr:Long chain acyl-CoA synthetase 7, peroxisomal [Vanrija pseudolonga]